MTEEGLSLLARFVKIDGGSQICRGFVQRLVEGGGRDERVEIGLGDVHELSDRGEGLGVRGEQEAMHVGELLLQPGERAGNGVELNLQQLVRRAVDHVVRSKEAADDRLIGGTAKRSLGNGNEVRSVLVGHTTLTTHIRSHSFSCSNSHSGFLQIWSNSSWNRAFRARPFS